MADITINDWAPELLAERDVRGVPEAEQIVAWTGGGYFPELIKLQDGSLGAVVRGGAGHVGVMSRLDWVRSWDGGKSWCHESIIVPGTREWDNRGSTAGQLADGTIVVVYWENYCYYGFRFDYWSDEPTRAFYVYSTDHGLTWSKKQRVKARPACDEVTCHGQIFALPDGTGIMPVHGVKKGLKYCRSIVLRSHDHGRTWGEPSVIADGYNEVSLAQLKDGTFLAAMRDDHSTHDVGTAVARSTDGGQTWSQPVAVTKPHQHPASILQLQSGNVLLTYGNRIWDLAVGAMISRDGGLTWDKEGRVNLARNSMVPNKNGADTGYPSTVQLDDGTIVTVYYRVGNGNLAAAQQERCMKYLKDTFGPSAPACQEMRAFEQLIAVRYREEHLAAK
jgi:hypothetical protein